MTSTIEHIVKYPCIAFELARSRGFKNMKRTRNFVDELLRVYELILASLADREIDILRASIVQRYFSVFRFSKQKLPIFHTQKTKNIDKTYPIRRIHNNLVDKGNIARNLD